MTAEQEYQDMISGLITEIEARPEHFRHLDGLMTDLVLDHPATLRLIRPLSAHPLNHKPAAFHAAMNRRRRVEAADARQAAKAQREADKKALLDESAASRRTSGRSSMPGLGNSATKCRSTPYSRKRTARRWRSCRWKTTCI
jgi:hypothetical protein